MTRERAAKRRTMGDGEAEGRGSGRESRLNPAVTYICGLVCSVVWVDHKRVVVV